MKFLIMKTTMLLAFVMIIHSQAEPIHSRTYAQDGHRYNEAPLYSVTDLGLGSVTRFREGYQLQSNPDGHTYGLSNSDGSITYAFDKSPVTPINERTDLGVHQSYRLLTMQIGSNKVGYVYDQSYADGAMNAPTSVPWSNGWDTPPGISPVSDMNRGGQIVGRGTSDKGRGGMDYFLKDDGSYAAFSDLKGNSHGWGAANADNLNNYIPDIPGATLTWALKIDDQGRILTRGSNAHNYLLTPVELGPAATVPEPTALITFTLISLIIGFRARCLKPFDGR